MSLKSSKKMNDWMKETGNLGHIKEREEEIAYRKQEAEQRRRRFLQQRGLPLDISDEDYLKWWEKELLDHPFVFARVLP